LVLVLALGACSNGGAAKRAVSTTASTPGSTTAPVCVMTAPANEVTYVQDGRLWAVAPGGAPRCLRDGVRAGARVIWGPAGDRVLLGNELLLGPAPPRALGFTNKSRVMGFSTPTGTQVLAIGQKAGLTKWPVAGGTPKVIAFVDNAETATYHPAGRDITAVGSRLGDPYGIYLATNTGQDGRRLVNGEDAKKVTDLAYSHDGTVLYFVGQHDDGYHLHAYEMAAGKVDTLLAGKDPVGDVVVSPFASPPPIAFRTGSCDERVVTRVHSATSANTPVGGTLASRSTVPVGYLGDGTLVVAARASGCTGPADLWAWKDGRAARIAEDVSVAAVRVIQPPPPPPPGNLPNQAPA
jgi:hypothetical protein